MILHQPYGHDDPYRPLPVERTPRDPEPGEWVQVVSRPTLGWGKRG